MLSSKRVLITGGAGFLGSHLAERLLKEGHYVVALDNCFTGSKKNIAHLMNDYRFTFVLYDITQPYWGRFDEIYNLACPASPVYYQHNPVETMKTSVLGVTNMLELALKTGAKMLQASTSEIYGDPLVHPQPESYWGNVNTIGVRSCYDEGKRCAETLCYNYKTEFGVDVRAVRIFNTYGPKMHPQDGRVISNFIMQALSGEDITIYGDGSQTRSFQYCDDLIEAMTKYMAVSREKLDAFFSAHGMPFPVVNTGNPGEYTIKELAECVLSKMPETSSKIVHRDLPLDDPKRRKPDISLAKELLGWEPKVSLSDGLDATIRYFKNEAGL